VTSLLRTLGTRVVPSLLIAFGLTLTTAGLIRYATPPNAGPLPEQPPVTVELASPVPEATVAPTLPSAGESFVPATPLPSALPVGWPVAASDRVATRVVVAELKIDLAVIKPGDEDYPLCGVAMYYPSLGQPGGGRSVYLYAHARTGMFLPILDASKIRNGQRMLGMMVDVYTSDDLVFRYEITQVRRHQMTFTDAFAADTEQLWLQTSEGPRGTPGKTQVVARPASIAAAEPAAAHPRPRPFDCS
jgi:hypothetical protein